MRCGRWASTTSICRRARRGSGGPCRKLAPGASPARRSTLDVRLSWRGGGGDVLFALGGGQRLERPVEAPAFLSVVRRLGPAALRSLVLRVLFHASSEAIGVRSREKSEACPIIRACPSTPNASPRQ